MPRRPCWSLFLLPMTFALAGSVLLVPVCAGAAEGDAPAFRWKDSPEAGTADLLYGDDPVLRYMYAYDTSTEERAHETYKVYHHVFGPGSKTIVTKGPGGLYTHHRGLYVGWNKTGFEATSLDFWHCTKGAHQKHAKFLKQEGDDRQGTMTAEIHWNDADGKPVIVETRTVTATRLPADAGQGWQLDWRTKLESRRGEITLDGDRQHAGFQFRAAQPVAEANGARYIRPEGFPQQPEAVQVGDQGDPPAHINLGWFATTYELEGTRYTVEYFEDPSLPKPSLYSERPYGRFGAFFKTTLDESQPLEMRYRVIVTAGEAPSREAIQKRYDEFVASLKQ